MSNTPTLDILAEALPEIDEATLLRELLAKHHPLPAWSTMKDGPSIRVDKTAHAGAFCVGYYADPERTDPITRRRGEVMVVLSRRGKEKAADGQPLYSVTGGGYREFGDETTPGEQPAENAVRELREETLDDEGKPILDVAPDRLQDILKVGTDYRNVGLPVDYVGYALPLTTAEYQAIAAHGERLANDPAYKQAVFNHTHDEVAGYEVMPLSEALKLQPDQFAHPHEFGALQNLSTLLGKDNDRSMANSIKYSYQFTI